MSRKSLSREAHDNRANQLNPCHPAYHRSRGASAAEAAEAASHCKAVRDNRANQLNPTSDTYHRCRGLDEQPGAGGETSSEKQLTGQGECSDRVSRCSRRRFGLEVPARSTEEVRTWLHSCRVP